MEVAQTEVEEEGLALAERPRYRQHDYLPVPDPGVEQDRLEGLLVEVKRMVVPGLYDLQRLPLQPNTCQIGNAMFGNYRSNNINYL